MADLHRVDVQGLRGLLLDEPGDPFLLQISHEHERRVPVVHAQHDRVVVEVL